MKRRTPHLIWLRSCLPRAHSALGGISAQEGFPTLLVYFYRPGHQQKAAHSACKHGGSRQGRQRGGLDPIWDDHLALCQDWCVWPQLRWAGKMGNTFLDRSVTLRTRRALGRVSWMYDPDTRAWALPRAGAATRAAPVRTCAWPVVAPGISALPACAHLGPCPHVQAHTRARAPSASARPGAAAAARPPRPATARALGLPGAPHPAHRPHRQPRRPGARGPPLLSNRCSVRARVRGP